MLVVDEYLPWIIVGVAVALVVVDVTTTAWIVVSVGVRGWSG